MNFFKFTFILKTTTVKVVEPSVTVRNRPIQDFIHPTKGHLDLVSDVLESFSLTAYKAHGYLRLTGSANLDGVLKEV